jgi:MFS family permease
MLGGRLADLLGRRLVLISGLAIFTAASLLARLAESAELLVTSRAFVALAVIATLGAFISTAGSPRHNHERIDG